MSRVAERVRKLTSSLIALCALSCAVGSSSELALAPSTPEIDATDLRHHVAALTDSRTEGRRTGTRGERIAAAYLARAFAEAGLAPAGDAGDYFQRFSFNAGISLGPANQLRLFSTPDPANQLRLFSTPDIETSGRSPRTLEPETDWRPLAFSRSGAIPPSEIVFAGYGLVAAGNENRAPIDDYAALDVKDRWVLIFRDLPQSLDTKTRQALRRHAGLRYKAMLARDRGARGVLFVSGPLGRFREQLVPLRFDASLSGTRIAVASISDSVAAQLLGQNDGRLDRLHQRLDEHTSASLRSADAAHPRADTTPALPALLKGERLEAEIDLVTERASGTNVIGRLQLGDRPSEQTIVFGAHFDHLGRGHGSSSLADSDEVGEIHQGADDNASGTALLIEVAESLSARKQAGEDLGARDFLFAAWSGEELGLLGSDDWAESNVNPHTNTSGPVAYLNFDMVGRLRDDLIIQGLGSSEEWSTLFDQERPNALEIPTGLELTLQQDSYVPTDATSFYTRGVPILAAFTGVHSEYHTPRDTADLLNFEGGVLIGQLFERIGVELGRAESPPDYQAQKAPAAGRTGGGFRVFLGTIPDYAQTDVIGVRLAGVAPEGPAEKAGLRRGDTIIEVAGRPIENLYDYTYALEEMRVGFPVRVILLRGDKRTEVEVVPGSRA